MIEGARYAHTNLVARDFRALAGFYQDVFGCVIVPPERNYSAEELERGTGVPGVGLQGVHMRLPVAAARARLSKSFSTANESIRRAHL